MGREPIRLLKSLTRLIETACRRVSESQAMVESRVVWSQAERLTKVPGRLRVIAAIESFPRRLAEFLQPGLSAGRRGRAIRRHTGADEHQQKDSGPHHYLTMQRTGAHQFSS
jgi:hypothetical protein